MDRLERWFRRNIDEAPVDREEVAKENEEAKKQQVDAFCDLARIKEEKDAK